MLTGFGPTAVGYLIQGGAKFAGYELWKKKLVEIAGDQETAVKYRTAIYLGASSVAEYVLFNIIAIRADFNLPDSLRTSSLHPWKLPVSVSYLNEDTPRA